MLSYGYCSDIVPIPACWLDEYLAVKEESYQHWNRRNKYSNRDTFHSSLQSSTDDTKNIKPIVPSLSVKSRRNIKNLPITSLTMLAEWCHRLWGKMNLTFLQWKLGTVRQQSTLIDISPCIHVVHHIIELSVHLSDVIFIKFFLNHIVILTLFPFNVFNDI